MNSTRVTAAIVVGLGVAFALTQHGLGQGAAAKVPTWQADSMPWPQLPNGWVTGPVTSVAAGKNGHVWVVHRPRLVPDAQKAKAAPPILEFDDKGAFVKGWGGTGQGFDWPTNEHGLYIDYKGNFWLTGSSPSGGIPNSETDNMIVKFNSAGKFLLQIGGHGQPGGNNDTKNFERATDVDVYQKTNEVFVSDGYGNRRVMVFDADTGAFKRMWGAFGKPPDSEPPANPRPPANAPRAERPVPTGDGPPVFANPVHCVKISNDGLVYVCDRTNYRIQVFTPDGKYVKQVFLNLTEAGGSTAASIAFSPDQNQTYMYVADYGNSHLHVMERKTLKLLYSFGKRSADRGDFQGIHMITVDPKGNLYTAEVAPGSRAQRFFYKGMGTPPAGTALFTQPQSGLPLAQH